MRALLRSGLLLTSALGAAVAVGCGGDDSPDAAVFDSGGPRDSGSTYDGGGLLVGRVVLSTDTLDLGRIVVTSTGSASLTITNPGFSPVVVTVGQPSGADAVRFRRSVNVPGEGDTFTLEPSGIATVTVRASAAVEGPLSAGLSLDSCGGDCPSTIALRAEGVRTGIVCPDEVDLGVANPGSCITAQVSCENRGNLRERITAANLNPSSAPAFELEDVVLPVNVEAGGALDMMVQYCPTQVDSDSGEILVATFRPFETEHTISLVARGGGADVRCRPTTLEFGRVGLGATVRGAVECESRGAEDAVITARITSGSEFRVTETPMPLRPGTTGVIEVTHTPNAVGPKQGSLLITTNDPDTPTIEVPLSAEAIEAGPCSAVMEPSAIEFGLVSSGDARPAAVVIRNTGNDDCLVRQIAITADSNPAFRLRNAPQPGAVLVPGGTLRLDVEFVPTLSAVSSGELEVSFSNPGTTQLSVMLSGTGGSMPMVPEPGTVVFGPTPMGCAEPIRKRILLRRVDTGTGPLTNIQITGANSFALEGLEGLPVVLGFDETFELFVTFTPTQPGLQSARIQVYAGGTPTPTVITVVGEGAGSVTRTETFTLAPRAVDVLFVVDDSCSMGPAQAALAVAASELEATLVAHGMDARLGFITTDMADKARSGRLQGMPTTLDATSPNLLDQLRARFQPGIGGSGDEQGILAAVTAVTAPLVDAENNGFLRASADLAIVIVSDEEDVSPGAPAIGAHVTSLRNAAGQGRLLIAGIVGPTTADCVGPYGPGQASPRYAQLIGRAVGLKLSFCDDMSENLIRVTDFVLGGTSFPLGAIPAQTSLEVRVNGSVVPSRATSGDLNWRYDLGSARLVFLDRSLVPSGATVDITYDAICVSPSCGDMTIAGNEQCDDGNESNADDCIRCYDAVCGDGFTQAGVEECDDGNLQQNDTCLSTCVAARCGDGILQAGVEECDDGNTVGGDACPSTCRFYQSTGPVSATFVPLANGTPITFTGGANPLDDGLATVTLPFTFSFFDVPTSSVTVSVNGFLAIGSTFASADSFNNTAIPAEGSPNGIVAAWWDDLVVDTAINGGSSITWEVVGSGFNRAVVFEWRDVRFANHSTNNHRRFTFQIALYETSNVVEIRYAQTETQGGVPTAVSASAGIEDQTGQRGIEALGCSPACDGRPRPPRADGFPQDSRVTFTP